MVTRVVDGDSIEVAGSGPAQSVRLAGINAPELSECFGPESLAGLEERVLDREVTLETIGTDQFGRVLAHVFVDDTHINSEVVRLGLAMATTPESDQGGSTAIVEAESAAYRERVGLWGTSACGATGPLPEMEFSETSSDFNPSGPDDVDLAAETIALTNRAAETVDLAGWTIRDESSRHRFTFGGSSSLAPGETLIVTSADPGWDPGGSPVWNNDGDMALLLDPRGTVVARWRY